jgi:phosphatidylserine/phosphatidylglycerophosphate/cardiolipin synthase-like enzyme
MRFSSRTAAGGRVFAVTGVNTASFAVLAGDATRAGLLGFAVERLDKQTGQSRFMAGFKVFRSLIPDPGEGIRVSTRDHPVQSFVWDDFTLEANREYRFQFHPLRGRPDALDRSTRPLSITIRTEPLFTTGTHDVFFNRGVASSQAYVRRFGTDPIDKLPPDTREQALAWLSRDLDDAILRFVDSCQPGDRLLGCFYEFRYPPAAERLAAAVARGVDVALVVDAKVNEHTDADGKVEPSFPRAENLATIAAAGLGERVTLREARRTNIAHNKFMVRLAGGTQPVEVWTGSTNLSRGGIHGQTNVGHWVRDRSTAERFAAYWQLLADDPGGRDADSRRESERRNAAFEAAVQELSPAPADLREVPAGITAVFSPRPDTAVLGSYARLLDSAKDQGCITLAFGISSVFKELLADNTANSQLVFVLLEKKDEPRRGDKTPFVRINATNNVYKAWGAFLHDPVYQWARETDARKLGLNSHVGYIHSKFMLIDPLGDDPIVVTGSANFSAASIGDNDENMIVIRGDGRVADIYLTEFNRLFNHYYYRSVVEQLHRDRRQPNQPSPFLDETDEWQAKYAPGTFRAKRLALFASMAGCRTL